MKTDPSLFDQVSAVYMAVEKLSEGLAVLSRNIVVVRKELPDERDDLRQILAETERAMDRMAIAHTMIEKTLSGMLPETGVSKQRPRASKPV